MCIKSTEIFVELLQLWFNFYWIEIIILYYILNLIVLKIYCEQILIMDLILYGPNWIDPSQR